MRPEKELIIDLLKRENMSKSKLAYRLGKYKSTVCETLSPNGYRSMLVSDLVEYVNALGYELTLKVTKRGEGQNEWLL